MSDLYTLRRRQYAYHLEFLYKARGVSSGNFNRCVTVAYRSHTASGCQLTCTNAILLRSYCMASWKKSTFLSAVVDKGRKFLGNRSTHSLPGDLHHDSTTNPLSSPSKTSQKRFKKSNDARHDMGVLAMTYILQDNPTFRELIRLIIGLNDHDDSGKVGTTHIPWSS